MTRMRRVLDQTQWLEAIGIDPFWIVDEVPLVPEPSPAAATSKLPQADWLLFEEPAEVDSEIVKLQAAKLLDAMLASLGLKRDQGVCIIRGPIATEFCARQHIIHQQIAEVQPKIVIALGLAAAQSVLHAETSLERDRGCMHEHHQEGLKVPVVVTFAPAHLLTHPENKGQAWQDLLLAQAALTS